MPLFFLGGVHGVGKSTLAQTLAPRIGCVALSASSLIREEGVEPADREKRVANIADNQLRLIRRLAHHQQHHDRVLLDGHFCLTNAHAQATPIEIRIFRHIAPAALLLLVDRPAQIARRLAQRDLKPHNVNHIARLARCERATAELVSRDLAIPLRVLEQENAVADATDFIESLSR